jgi:hypothetical protein
MLGQLAITNGEECSENTRDIFIKSGPTEKKLPTNNAMRFQNMLCDCQKPQQTAIGFDL